MIFEKSRRQTFHRSVLASSISMLGMASWAQGNTADVTQLDQVVVTASGFAQKIQGAPASISIITAEDLAKQPFANLEDAVRHLEGLSIVGSDAGGKDISIRGMSADYTVVLVDGKRRNARETRTRGGSTGVQANLIPPLDAIERIEVVRGPMSSLYGADAMGGVINIITRKVPANWGGSVSLESSLANASGRGHNKQGRFYLGGPLHTNLLGLQVYGQTQRQQEDQVWAGRPDARERATSAKLTLTPNANHTVQLEGGYDDLRRQANLGQSVRPVNARSKGLHSNDRRNYWALTHKGQWGLAQTELGFTQETNRQREIDPATGKVSYDGDAEPKLQSSVLDALATLPLDSHTLKLGVQVEWRRLSNISGENGSFNDGNTPDANGRPTPRPNPHGAISEAKRKSWALLAEDAWDMTDDFTLTAGLRLDKDEYYGSHVTPRLYGVYQASSTVTLRGGVAKGFKPATLRQVIPNYATSSGGPSLKPGVLYGNADLKPETSANTELGVRYDAPGGVSAGLTLFNNDINNKITSDHSGGDDPKTGAPLYVYRNVDKVRIRGAEAFFSAPVSATVDVSANYTYTDSKRLRGSEKSFVGDSLDGYPLDKTPKHMGNLRVDWQPSDLSAWARVNYLGKQYWAAYRNGPSSHVRERGSSTTLDLGASYELNHNVTLNAAVLNVGNRILDVDYSPVCGGPNSAPGCGPAGNWMADPGRQFWLGATVRF